MEKVNVVVVTYNRKELLVECLSALLAQTYTINKIFVIDNCSTDGTKELLDENYKDDKIECVHLKKNYGGSGGFYYGIREAYLSGCDWVWAMDDDTIPCPTALKELIEARNLIDGDISFLASTVYGPDREPMNVPELSKRKSDNGYKYWYRYLNYGIVEIETATLVSLLFNSKAIEKLGAPHPFFFIWGDDTEYTLRLTSEFGPAYFVGSSEVVHKRYGAKSLSIIEEDNKNRIAMYKYMYCNHYVIYKYYFPFHRKLAYKLKVLRDLMFCILKSKRFKIKKFNTILRGYFRFKFGKYNKKAFIKRKQNCEKNIMF